MSAGRAPMPPEMAGIPQVTQPSSSNTWLAKASPVLSAIFIAFALATIPYGAPVPGWYFWIMSVAGLIAAIATVLSLARLGWALIWWPVPVILVAWALATLASGFPREVAERSWGMAYYALLFPAAQVACRSLWGRKLVVLTVLAVLATIALDLWWQADSGYSLVRETRYRPRIWIGGTWEPETANGAFVSQEAYIDFLMKYERQPASGSFGNRNDQAVVGILAPLCAAVVPSIWAWAFAAMAYALAGYLAIAGTSRQLLLGLGGGLATLGFLRASHRVRWWTVIGAVALLAAVATVHPATRARLVLLKDAPLADRGLPIAYGAALFLGNPVLGVGPSLYGHHYVAGVREGWTFAGKQLDPTGMPWVHCLPVEVACEMGTVGIAAFGAVVWSFVRHIHRAIAIRGPARDMGIAVVAAASSMALIGLLDLTLIKDWVRICWWLLLGLGFAAPSISAIPRASTGSVTPGAQ